MSRPAHAASSMPKIFLVAYPLPNGEMHLAFRSEAINGTEVIAKIDSAEKYNAMVPFFTVLPDSTVPSSAWEQHVLPFLPSKDFKFSSKINATTQCDYFRALHRFINPHDNCHSTKFFQANRESLLTELELEILGDLVLNGEKAIAEFCFNQLSDTQLEQVFNSKTKIKATDYSARKYEYTLLQLGIAAGDVSFNENNVGIVEIMLEYLKRHDPENYQGIFTGQALALFDQSLRVYLSKQEKEIVRLYKLKASDAVNEKIQEAQARVRNYTAAISSQNLNTILTAHIQAQRDNRFNDFDAVISEIENASDADIQAVLDDPTIDSQLSNALKKFREAFTQHTHSEKIVNREHLLKIFELNDAFNLRVMNADPNSKKRRLFWCHLVGEAERRGLAACDAQIFANPGFYSAVENRKPNMRSLNFNFGGGSIFPLSFDSNSGLGYKFAAVAAVAWSIPCMPCFDHFQNLCRAKTSSLENLCSTQQLIHRAVCA